MSQQLIPSSAHRPPSTSHHRFRLNKPALLYSEHCKHAPRTLTKARKPLLRQPGTFRTNGLIDGDYQVATSPAALHSTVPGTSRCARAHRFSRASDPTCPPDPLYPPNSPPRPIFSIKHSTKGYPPCLSGWFEVWAGGSGHSEHFHKAPLYISSDARHHAMPTISEISADLANLVGDTITAANSSTHSLPGSTATASRSWTSEHSSCSHQRSVLRTSAGVRRPRGITAQNSTSSDSGLTADRPKLSTPLSLASRDSFPTLRRTRQEPPALPPPRRPRTTAGIVSFSEYVPPLSHMVTASRRDLQGSPSRLFHRHGHPPRASTTSTTPPTLSDSEAAQITASPTTSPYTPQSHPTPSAPFHYHRP